MIEVKDLTISFGDSQPVLKNFSQRFNPGECVLINGATGSGKSTLLKALNGLIPHHFGGRVGGQIMIDELDVANSKPAHLSHLIGYVWQNPFHGFVCETVEDEIAFGLESHGWQPSLIENRVDELCHSFNLVQRRQQRLHTLSAGEAQKVAIAAAVAMRPPYLLVDEPTSALDEESAHEIIAFLKDYSRDRTVIIAEHRSDALRPFISREITLQPVEPHLITSQTIAHLKVIYGPNGSGKTTYLNAQVAGTFDTCGYIPQNPSDILLTQSVKAECELSGFEKSRALLARIAPEISLDAHPRDLSEGQKLSVALAVTLGREPRTLVLDEPTRGLDPALKHTIISLLSELQLPITIATHDADLIALAGDQAHHIGAFT